MNSVCSSPTMNDLSPRASKNRHKQRKLKINKNEKESFHRIIVIEKNPETSGNVAKINNERRRRRFHLGLINFH